MNVIRFPEKGLSADYGDIILGSVQSNIEVLVTYEGKEILHEIYSPDIHGEIYIRDLGSLAMLYNDIDNIGLFDSKDGSSVKLNVSIIEKSTNVTKSVTIYCCDAFTNGTLTDGSIQRIPLSRGYIKPTGIGKKEYISFYASGEIFADVLYMGLVDDETITASIGIISSEEGSYYRFDVSPSIIASLCGISESNIISYSVHKAESQSVTFEVDRRKYLNSNTFIFKNTFGAQETFSCIGDDESERRWTRSFGSINRNQIQITSDLTNTYKVNTGYISSESIKVVEDLLNSSVVYHLVGDDIRRISILEESFREIFRKDQLNAVEFKFKYTTDNQSFFIKDKVKIFDSTFDRSFN